MSAVAEAWENWLKVLESHGFNPRAMTRPGASEEDIEFLRHRTGIELPEEVAALYRLTNGQHESWRSEVPGATNLFPCYRFLSIAEAVDAWEGWKELDDLEGPRGMADHAEHVEESAPDKVATEYWIPGWLPFALDGGGNSLTVDITPREAGTVGQIIIIGSDEDERRVFASGMVAYLRALAEYPLEISEYDGLPTWDAIDLR
jgi:cell wall assembly regulator SMI1